MSNIDIDIAVQRGTFQLQTRAQFDAPIVGVFGQSGAGKTTLFHAIAGLVQPTRGCIAVGDRTLVDVEQRVNLPTHERRIGIVFQDGRLFPHQSVEQNLRYGMRWCGARTPAMEFDSLVELLGLAPLLKRHPDALSGGEQQRVALGRAILSAPDLLLMDEPLAALDRRLKRSILPVLRKVIRQAQIPMLYISHDLTEILSLTDQLVILKDGNVVGSGAWSSLAADADVLSHMLATGLFNVHEMTVAAVDDGGCTRLRATHGGETLDLLSARIDAPIGASVTVITRPEDIAFATGPIASTSIRNQFEATIARATEIEGRVVVEAVAADRAFLVEISTGSWTSLQLDIGKRVWCLLKANAIDVELDAITLR